MVREEGFYDIKRVDKLPTKGNANILYLLKDSPIESFYRWLPNKTYEDLKIGGSGSFPGFTDLPTDYGVTLGTVATTNDYTDLDNLPTLGNFVTKVGTPVNNQIGIWTGDGTLEGDSNFILENDSSFRRLNIGTSSTTGALIRLYGHSGVGANSGISLQNNAGNQTNQEWWNIFPLFSGSQAGSLNFQATTGAVVGSALQLQSSTLLPLAVSATNTNIDSEATGKVLITREWIEAQGFGAGGTDDQTASEVPFTPYLTIGSTDTQAAVQELKDELDTAVIGSLTKYSETFGNGIDTTITITHSLGTEDLSSVRVVEIATKERVYPTEIGVDTNNLNLVFSVAPTTNQYRVTITA